MEFFFEICRFLFPVLLVVLSVALLLGVLGPLLIPLACIAVVAGVVWLYLPRR
jgi:predicted RND superfamily exporter protein